MAYSVFAAAASPVFTAGISSAADGVRFGGIRAASGFPGLSSKFSNGFGRSGVISLRSLKIPKGFVTNGQRTPGVAFATAATEKSVHNFTVKVGASPLFNAHTHRIFVQNYHRVPFGLLG